MTKKSYKERRAAKSSEQRTAQPRGLEEKRNVPSVQQWLASRSSTSIELHFAVHELGHAALLLPGTEWHIAFGNYVDCPACKTLPHPPGASLPYLAHTRTLPPNRPQPMDIREMLYAKLAGGACGIACLPEEEQFPPMTVPGTEGTFAADMEDDFEMLMACPVVLPFCNQAYQQLIKFFATYRATFVSYATQLQETRVLYHHQVKFPFDPAEILFGDKNLNDPAYAAYRKRVCSMCGRDTEMWGTCFECRCEPFNAEHG